MEEAANTIFATGIIAHKLKLGISRIKNIKNIISVTSGKGGVGKSTVALNLALSLANSGSKVGILDADIYGPSLPLLVGERLFKPDVIESKFIPLVKFNLTIMSFGFLINEQQPAIWRGAIVTKAIDQLLYDTHWGDLDYLIIDTPPGTGDIHLTMAQKMPITATVIVTTPQDLALIDVIKSIAMYQKLSIPILGIIENMSYYHCSNCGNIEYLFGQGGANKIIMDYNYDLLGALALNQLTAQQNDIGIPIYLVSQEIASIYDKIALKLTTNLSLLAKDYSASIGKVGIVKT